MIYPILCLLYCYSCDREPIENLINGCTVNLNHYNFVLNFRCSLGDVTNNDSCYEKALEVSENRSARAKVITFIDQTFTMFVVYIFSFCYGISFNFLNFGNSGLLLAVHTTGGSMRCRKFYGILQYSFLRVCARGVLSYIDIHSFYIPNQNDLLLVSFY